MIATVALGGGTQSTYGDMVGRRQRIEYLVSTLLPTSDLPPVYEKILS